MLDDNSRIHIEWVAATQDKVPLLFLHSLGTDHRLWRYQREAVIGRTYGVLDSRGHGKSTAAQSVSLEEWVEDIRRVLDDAEIPEVILCGISMGGVQAMAFANAYPERVKGLVLADTFVRIPAENQESKISGTAGKALELGMDSYVDMYLDTTLTSSETATAIRPDLRDAIAGMSEAMYAASAKACFTADVRPRFHGIPTMVLIGEQDYKTPMQQAEEIVAAVPDARLETVPRAAHLSNVDNPKDFNRYLILFLDGVDER